MLTFKKLIRDSLGCHSELLSKRVKANRQVVANQKAGARQRVEPKLRTHAIMVREDQTVESRVMRDDRGVRPILFLENVNAFFVRVKFGIVMLAPLYRPAVALELWISAICLGAHLGQSHDVVEVRFGVSANYSHGIGSQ